MTKRGLVWLALVTLGCRLPPTAAHYPLTIPDPVGCEPLPKGNASRAKRTHRRGAAAATAM